jgi:hypothetical protein
MTSPAKAPAFNCRSASMTAILTILVFLLVIGALNLYEFGRLD